MNWQAHPFLRLLLPLVFGILFAEFFAKSNSPGFGILWAAILLAGFLSVRELPFSKRHWPGVAIVFATFLLGWQLLFLNVELNAPDHFSKKIDCAGPAFFVARVAADPVRTARKWKIRLDVEAVGAAADSFKICSGELLAYIDTTAEASDFGLGDQLVFAAKLEKPTPAAVRGEFDYAKYLHFQNIHYQAFTESGRVFRSEKDQNPSLQKWASRMRRHCLTVLRKHLPTDDEFAVASGLVVGYRADLSDEIRSAYLETGAMHALAVSGMHVGGLYLAMGWFFGFFSKGNRWRRVAEPVVSIGVIWAFALVTGCSPSIVRAAVMFTFFLIGRATRRDSSAINSLAASAFLLLIYEPKWLFDVGFQLSYLAVAGIVLFQKPIHRLLVAPNRAVNFFWEITSAGFAAQLATLPVSIYYFHQMPTYFWLSSLVVVPLGMPALIGGFALIFLDGVLPSLAVWLGKGLFWLVFAQNQALFWIQKLPVALVKNLWMSGFGAVAAYFFIASMAVWLMQKRPRMLVAASASLLVFSIDFCFEKLRDLDERQIRLGLFPRKNELSLVAVGEIWTTDAASFFEKDGGEKGPPPADFPIEKAGPLLRFLDKRIAFVDSEKCLGAEKMEPFAVDFVWLAGNPRVEIEEIMERFPFKKALFDASAPRWRAKKWAEECRALGVDFHDVRANGPFVFDF